MFIYPEPHPHQRAIRDQRTRSVRHRRRRPRTHVGTQGRRRGNHHRWGNLRRSRSYRLQLCPFCRVHTSWGCVGRKDGGGFEGCGCCLQDREIPTRGELPCEDEQRHRRFRESPERRGDGSYSRCPHRRVVRRGAYQRGRTSDGVRGCCRGPCACVSRTSNCLRGTEGGCVGGLLWEGYQFLVDIYILFCFCKGGPWLT